MAATRNATIAISSDLADRVVGKVRSGEYATIEDVIREGLAALEDRNTDLEAWLRDEVVQGHAEYLADPSQAIPAEDVLARIKARRRVASE